MRASPDAERIKTLYGSVLTGGSDERDMIAVPPVDKDEMEPPQFVSRASLVNFIKPRVEEIFEMVRDRLAASPFAAEPRGRVVLTGGGSQLTGVVRPGRADSRPARADRAAARDRGAPGGSKGAGICGGGRNAGLPASGPSRAFRTAANAALANRRRLYRKGRTMASRELLMTRHHIPSVGGGPTRPGGDFRV